MVDLETTNRDMEFKYEDLPCAIQVRITKRKGGVRLSLSNVKRSLNRCDQYVRCGRATHLTKEQFTTLTKISGELKAALTSAQKSTRKPIKRKQKESITTKNVKMWLHNTMCLN